jgi:hypothetical protein
MSKYVFNTEECSFSNEYLKYYVSIGTNSFVLVFACTGFFWLMSSMRSHHNYEYRRTFKQNVLFFSIIIILILSNFADLVLVRV